MLRKCIILACTFTLLIGSGITQLAAQSAALGGNANQDQLTTEKKQARDAEIKKLLGMETKARKDYLKSMDPKARRGLWMQLRREKAAFEGHTPVARGQYSQENQRPVSVDLSGTQWANRAVGMIAYDSDFPTVGFGMGSIIGNRFNTHTGVPVFANGTVNTVQALVVPGAGQTTSSAGFVLLGPQTTMGGAMAIFSTFTTASGVVDSVEFTGFSANYTGSSFYVLFGDFSNSYIPVFGTGTTLGQGHHGVAGYTGGMGPNITATGSFGGTLNAYIRAAGNIVPVELMNFRVE